MLRLVESSLASLHRRLVLVAPPHASCLGFDDVTTDSALYTERLHQLQRLRGSIYRAEGNIKDHELTRDGRHETPDDNRSWHLLMTDEDGQVRSCVLYLVHEQAANIDDLRVRQCPLLDRPESHHQVKGAVEAELESARRDGLRFAELGGWAISKERRGTPEGLMMVLAMYGLSRILGGALVITTANVAHSCSSILRRLGGAYLHSEGTPIPSYFDPRYNTEIELLRFDSRLPNPKYAHVVDKVMAKLPGVSVVSGSAQCGNTVTGVRPVYAA